MPELLLEFFCEEIPARMQARGAQALERAVNKALLDAGFMPDGVKAFATPRRLAVVASGLPARQPDRREAKKGPRVGAPEKAIEGFLKSAGLASVDDCEIREDKKGAFYVAVIDRKGRETADIIAEMVPEIVRGFSWPKSMRWGEKDLRWVRPLHSVLCAFNGEAVAFDVDGVASDDRTYGHRFMAPGEIQTRNFDDYVSKLRAAKVVLDADERKDMIRGDAATLCEAQGLELVGDEELLNEVAGLAEWPVAMIGAFDEKFLKLPDEVLTATMRGHQKYFSVKDPKTGRLANRFVFVANLEAPASDGGAAMRAGYERVLTARLSDAWYLYHHDLKTPLEARVAELDKVTFFEGLDSLGGKAKRIAALAHRIVEALGGAKQRAEKAAIAGRLAKADLVSAMVYEFPELQGVMGRYYATEEGIESTIADAIRDHYKPQGQDDEVPTAPISVAVALADKIDNLVGFWTINKKPSGSSDPFALRRAALGFIQTVIATAARLRLHDVIRWADYQHSAMDSGRLGSGPDAYSSDLIGFFHDRLKVYLRDKGHRYDAIDAVLMDADGNLGDDLVLIVRKLEALETFLKTDDGENLAAAYKRAANILKAEEKADGRPADAAAVNPAHFKQDEEKAFYVALEAAVDTAKQAVAEERFEDAMAALSALRAPIDAFFDEVTVNAEDDALRANRLAILARFRAATARVADFSKLEG